MTGAWMGHDRGMDGTCQEYGWDMTGLWTDRHRDRQTDPQMDTMGKTICLPTLAGLRHACNKLTNLTVIGMGMKVQENETYFKITFVQYI